MFARQQWPRPPKTKVSPGKVEIWVNVRFPVGVYSGQTERRRRTQPLDDSVLRLTGLWSGVLRCDWLTRPELLSPRLLLYSCEVKERDGHGRDALMPLKYALNVDFI